MASPILRGGNLIVTEQGIRDGVRQVLLPVWNAYSFLALYAPTKGTWRTDSPHVLDRYILAKLADLRDTLTEDYLPTADIEKALANGRSGAKPSLSFSLAKPITALPLKAVQMERHEFSSQSFVPMDNGRFFVIVAPHAPGGAIQGLR